MSRIDANEPDERLGHALGESLRRQVDGVRRAGLTVDDVRRGARQRRRVRRLAAATVCLVLVLGAGVALLGHGGRATPTNVPAPLARPALLPAYAVLGPAADVGRPVAMSAVGGGAPIGARVPEVDVWSAGSRTLVVRTFAATGGSSAATGSSATTADTAIVTATTAIAQSGQAPWGEIAVDPVEVRGVAGGIEQLAADQFAVWIPTVVHGDYTVVVGRGTTRDQVLADVEALAAVGSVLEPRAGFRLVERAPAASSSTASSARADVSYGDSSGPWVSSFLPLPGRTSIETAGWMQVGRMQVVDGRQVITSTDVMGRTVTQWIDPSGVVVSIVETVTDADTARLVGEVSMLDERTWVRSATEVSSSIATNLAPADHATIDGITVIRRHGDATGALCVLVVGADQRCAGYPLQPGQTESSTIQVEIGGQWIIAGYHLRSGPDDQPAALAGLRFSDPSGVESAVQWTDEHGADWYVVRVPHDVTMVSTNVGAILGGMIGWTTRPLFASTF